MVHTVDIFSTVAGITGVASTANDSISMLPYMSVNLVVRYTPQRQYMYTDRCTNSMFQAAIRDDQYKLIYRLPLSGVSPYTPDPLELYDVMDLAEISNLVGTGIAAEALLLGELNSMWASEGYNPELSGCP